MESDSIKCMIQMSGENTSSEIAPNRFYRYPVAKRAGQPFRELRPIVAAAYAASSRLSAAVPSSFSR